ncbi:restriction endonuclease subunit S [Maridesulfovibrio sp.]|uniref:restriction endonuclease subunit S n=1 Tax=Maridesulfovibrio sp. TaxID=2795000 RepID=UPI0039EE97AB
MSRRAVTISELIKENIADLQTGPFGTVLKAAEYSETGVPLISVREIRNGFFEITADTPRIDEKTTAKLPKYVLKHGDIVFGRKGGVERNARVNEAQDGWFLGSDGIRLRLSSTIDSKFISYQVRHPQIKSWLIQNSGGSTMLSLNQKILGRLPLVLPPLKTQQAIAHILGTIDDKIDLNRRMNETLEAMAQAIFKSWFVDFDGCTEFEDSELGRVPKGWRVAKIGDEISVVGGGTPATKNKDFWEGGTIHWTTPKDLSQSTEKLLLTTGRKITSKGLAKISSGLLPVNTVLLSSRAPVGYLALAKIPVAVNQGYIAMKCDKELSPEYVIQWCNSIMGEIKNRASGTTFAEISKKNFRNISVLVPEPSIMEKYSEIVAGYYDKIHANCKESQNLELIRDSLLPKLISGSIDLGDK